MSWQTGLQRGNKSHKASFHRHEEDLLEHRIQSELKATASEVFINLHIKCYLEMMVKLWLNPRLHASIVSTDAVVAVEIMDMLNLKLKRQIIKSMHIERDH